jgi:molybdopterin-guanine dinucleotide biosynthesis protein A
MGFAKSTLLVNGSSLARRLGGDLGSVCAPAPSVEVGPGRSGLPYVLDEDNQGPLVAFGLGLAELGRLGHEGAVLLLACDMPFVGPEVMEMLASWGEPGSIVPVVAGHEQPLCARWSAEHGALASGLVAAGERSMRALLDLPGVVRVDESQWSSIVPRQTFVDADTPGDLDRLGLDWSPGSTD